jgi:hypothetical protein
MQASAPHAQKTELDSECFDEFPEQRFELATKFPGDLQDLFVAGFQFREEFLLQLKCDLFVGGQDRAYSFANVRNLENDAQSVQRSCIRKYPLRKPFTVDLPNVHGLRHRSKPYRRLQ